MRRSLLGIGVAVVFLAVSAGVQARPAEPAFVGLYGAFGIGGGAFDDLLVGVPVGVTAELGWGFGHLRLSAEVHHFGLTDERTTWAALGNAYLDVTPGLWGGAKPVKLVPFVGVGGGQQWVEDTGQGFRRLYGVLQGSLGVAWTLRRGLWSQLELVPRLKMTFGEWEGNGLRGDLVLRWWF